MAYAKKSIYLKSTNLNITSLLTFNSYSQPISSFILCTSKNPPCSPSSLQSLSYFTTQQTGSQTYLNFHLHQQFYFLFFFFLLLTLHPTTSPSKSPHCVCTSLICPHPLLWTLSLQHPGLCPPSRPGPGHGSSWPGWRRGRAGRSWRRQRAGSEV